MYDDQWKSIKSNIWYTQEFDKWYNLTLQVVTFVLCDVINKKKDNQ